MTRLVLACLASLARAHLPVIEKPVFGPACNGKTHIRLANTYLADVDDEENCTCMSWQEAYQGKWVYNESADPSDTNFKAKKFYSGEGDADETTVNGSFIQYALCGEGHEFSPHVHDFDRNLEPIWDPDVEFCGGVFKQLGAAHFNSLASFNDCVNIAHDNAPDEWYGGSWCYVRPSCSSAEAINASYSKFWPADTSPTAKSVGKIKRCKAGEDSFLGDRTPGELYNMSQWFDIDMSTLVKLAYPVERNHGLMNVTVDGTLIANENATEDGKPIVLDSWSGRPPFVVQHGLSQYHVLNNLNHMRVSHKLTYSKFKCANTSWQPCLDSLVVDESVQKIMKKMPS